jgi:hypothetical protein
MRGNEKETCILKDVANLRGRNVFKKRALKILIYKDLTTEIQRMWNAKFKVIPVIIGATGTISKTFTQYLSDIQGNEGIT